MKPPPADIALLTDRRYTAETAQPGDWYLGNILHDDALLQQALRDIGLTSVRVDWADPGVEWEAFRCAVFRTTWDYFERFDEFSNWLGRIESRTRLCNVPQIIWWNLDKHYLADLHAAGVPVVPFRFIEKGEEPDPGRLLSESGWDEAVIKPCVSGAARLTYRLNAGNAAEVAERIAPHLKNEAFMLQPFMGDVARTGEDSLMVIGGQYTHAVRKVPKKGDFRVQDDHGGTVHPCSPAPEQIRLAGQAMAACSPQPVYGRVDMVRDDRGQWRVIELELIEPELWLRRHPEAARVFAGAIRGTLS
jgi:glutathione synthase/RimK-type ligase-like ATP-grasp enzyme